MSTQLTYTRGNTAQTIVFDSAKRSFSFEAELTDSPQERRAVQTDGAINKPSSATLDVQISDYPLGGGRAVEVGRAARIFNELIKVKTDFLVCSLVGGPTEIAQCRIQKIELDQTKPTAGALAFRITLREVLISEARTAPLITPTERTPQKRTDKGDKTTTQADANASNQSYLQKGRNAISKFFGG